MRLAASQAGNSAAYTKAVETAYCKLWADYCRNAQRTRGTSEWAGLARPPPHCNANVVLSALQPATQMSVAFSLIRLSL